MAQNFDEFVTNTHVTSRPEFSLLTNGMYSFEIFNWMVNFRNSKTRYKKEDLLRGDGFFIFFLKVLFQIFLFLELSLS